MARLFIVLCTGMILLCGNAPSASQSVGITEILTQNKTGLEDEDGTTSAWIELFNAGPTEVTLGGWSITDHEDLSRRWLFPATNLNSGSFLIVFASGKNRASAGKPLHAGFELAAENGYLALLDPGGGVRSELKYGAQKSDMSFGVGRSVASQPLVAIGAAGRILVPDSDAMGRSWTGGNEPFEDSTWLPVTTGIGFDLSTGAGLGLLGYWSFNTLSDAAMAVDDSGYGHHGVVVAPAVYTADAGGRTGKPGDRAMNFGRTGNNARVTLPDVLDGWLDSTRASNAISVSLWTFGDSSQPGDGSVFWADSPAGSGSRAAQAHLPWSDSVVYWDTGGTDPAQHRVSVAVSNSASWKGRWNHYLLLKNGASKEIWLNGIRILNGTSTAPLSLIRSFNIGSGPNGTYSYGGLIDDFAVWNRGLSEHEIRSIAAGASPLETGRLTGFIATDIGNSMHGVNASVYLRVRFNISDLSEIRVLTLKVHNSDGFVAYLNGTPVTRRSAPDSVAFDSQATTERPMDTISNVESIDLSGFVSLLRSGENILAFQGLNHSALDDVFLLEPELESGKLLGHRYFSTPTPGAQNDEGAEGFVGAVEFTKQRGFYELPFDLTLQVATTGATLVFTLDGSEPTSTHGNIASATHHTLRVTNTTLVRAMAYRSGFHPSVVETHTYLFPNQVNRQKRPPVAGSVWPGGTAADFEIDPRVVTNALPNRTFDQALRSIPTLSVAGRPAELFGPDGIYARAKFPRDSSQDLEIHASVEWILPEDRQGFQENAGFEIHGNITQDKTFTPKHSFNVKFRRGYGPGKLRFPIFPDSPAREFNRLVLRGGSTDTWATINWDTQIVDGVARWWRDEASYVRDQWVRDTQLAMGQASAHGIYAHLFLNGIYWGLYDVCERPDEDFASTYYGGDSGDYDVLADFADVHAGDNTAWNELQRLAGLGLRSDAAFQRIQGNHSDGTRNPAYPVLLDVTNLVDYMILHIYIGADDWPNHNWWAARRRGPESTGFKFFAWDQEISINSLVRQHSSWGPVYAEADVANTPTFVYSRCRENAEFIQMFADRVQHHLFNGGALSLEENRARWDARISEIDKAVVAESARWGDSRRPQKPYTREVEWLSSNAWMRAVFFPSNQQVALKRFQNARLYPSVGAPRFSQFGGEVSPGFRAMLSHTNASGSILYTLDGSDPRQRGGAVSPQALAYSEPVEITRRTTIKARTRLGPNWSAMVTATFVPSQDLTPLMITEIMYHPVTVDADDADALEFLELKNTGGQVLDLSGLAFVQGIAFGFPDGSLLGPGQFVVLVRNPGAFATRYPGISPFGTYQGKLADGGETIALQPPDGGSVVNVDYSDEAPWPLAADGADFSLVPDERALETDPSRPTHWRADSAPGGSPGRDDPPNLISVVVVNEVQPLSRFRSDTVELANLSSAPADISGWYLTDDAATPKKFRFPPGTLIREGGYLLVDESSFNSASQALVAFSFSAAGDEVYLFSADPAGNLTGYSHGFHFGACEEDVSFGRYVDSQNQEHVTALATATFGDVNSGPRVGPVVITEIHYHPEGSEDEFLELCNISDRPVPMFDGGFPDNVWMVRGLNYSLPSGLTLLAGQRLLIVSTEPAPFRQVHGVPAEVVIVGPYRGVLQDSGERLELMKPVTPTTAGVAYAIVDEVRYNDRAPWPPAADGAGPSLQRRNEAEFGDDPLNWIAARATPGTAPTQDIPPKITRQPASQDVVERGEARFEVGASGGERLSYQWQKNGQPLQDREESILTFEHVSLDDQATYRVAVFNAAGSVLSAPADLTVRRLPFIYAQPVSRVVASNSTANVAVAADGTGKLRYQWQLDGVEILGATNAQFRIVNMRLANEGVYVAKVADEVGTTFSEPARLQILETGTAYPTDSSRRGRGWRGDVHGICGRHLATPLSLAAREYDSAPPESDVDDFGLAVGKRAVESGGDLLGLRLQPSRDDQLGARRFADRLADGDRDLLPTEWETAFGLDPNDPSDAFQDPDADGASNRDEYVSGTDPKDPASHLRWGSIVQTSEGVELGFLGVSNKNYSVLFSDRLDPPAWRRLADLPAVGSAGKRMVVDKSARGQARYYRLSVNE